jgi:hypothetical protein
MCYFKKTNGTRTSCPNGYETRTCLSNLPSKNRLHLEGNVVKMVKTNCRLYKKISAVLAPIVLGSGLFYEAVIT